MQESTSVQSASADGFDYQAWYEAIEPTAICEPDPAVVLLEGLGKNIRNWASRGLYPKGHAKEKKPNGATNGLKRALDCTNGWRKTLEKDNAGGRIIYFVVNDGGHDADSIKHCRAHFAEWDPQHNFTPADFLAHDWTTHKKHGWFQPSAGVYSGNRSPHGYWFLEEPYTNPYHWRINQVRWNAVLGSDPSVNDPSRLLRLPGFHHATADGQLGRKALLLFCDAERRYSIKEIEAKLLEHEQANGVDVFDLLPAALFTPKHRDGLISGLVAIWGEEIVEEFEEWEAANSRGRGKFGSFFDGRRFEEIHKSFELIPPYEPGNGTYLGENPVTTADGREVRIRYFSLLAGLKAAFLQILKTEQDCIDFVCEKWPHLDQTYIATTIRSANGSVQSGTYWRFAEQCGYKLRTQLTADKSAKKQLLEKQEGQSWADSVKDQAKALREIEEELYQLSAHPVGAETYEKVRALKKLLEDAFNQKPEQTDQRLIEMIAERHGFPISGVNETERVVLNTPTNRFYEDLVPDLIIKGSDCTIVGEPGAGKTTAAIATGDAVISGGTLPFASGKVTDTGRVLFIATDGGDDAQTMVETYAQSMRIDLPGHMARGDWSFLAARPEEKQISWSFCVRDIEFLINLLEQAQEEERPYRLVIIDTLMAVLKMGGIDPGVGPVERAMRLMHAIAHRYGASLLWLHHTIKSDNGQAAGSADITRYCNSYHLLKNAESKSGDGLKVTELHTKKHRGGEKDRKVYYTLSGTKQTGQKLQQVNNLMTPEQQLRLIFLEMKRDGHSLSTTQIASYVDAPDLDRRKVATLLASARRKNEWCDTDSSNKWSLTHLGREVASKWAEEERLKVEHQALEMAGIDPDTAADEVDWS